MTLRITVDIFSGRPNPTIIVDGPQAAEVLRRLKPGRKLKGKEARPLPSSTLGYRGLIIEQEGAASGDLPQRFRFAHGDVFGPRLSHRVEDEHFEDFFSGSTGLLRDLSLGAGFLEIFKKEVERFKEVRARHKGKPHHERREHRCECAPLYEPAWWNVPQRQPNNNCYNYATNYRTDTFAQPGLAAGAMYAAFSCPSVRPAAEKDELISSPKAKNKCPKEGHLVALVIFPGGDFHWYRKGRNGFWSHKPGPTAVTNVDNSGVAIPDPRTADRGPYTVFCTFMVVMHGHIKIA